MQLPWFRAYTEMVDDEKLRLLAFEDRWHFMALLCLKGRGVLDDAGPLMMRKVAVKMGIDTRTLAEVGRRLAEVGLIDQESLQPLRWNSRQMRSDTDPTAADRKRRQRAKAKAGPALQSETDGVRVTAGDVTRTDRETDADTEAEKNTNEAAAVTAGAGLGFGQAAGAMHDSKAKAATRLADAWMLPQAWCDWAMQARPDLTDDDVRKQAEVFADFWHAKAGADAKKLDWLATWRNWIRRCETRKPFARQAFGAQYHSGETSYQRSMRERAQEAVPSIARQAPEASPADFFKSQAIEVAARRIERPQKNIGGAA